MALNKILQGILKDFTKKYGLEDISKVSKQYEYLINYLIISKYYPDAFSDRNSARSDMDTVIVDEKGQYGLDSIIFIVNGHLVLSVDDLDIYINSGSVSAELIFIQTKTEEGFNSGDLLKEIDAVKIFLDDPSKLNEQNDNVKNAAEIFERLFHDYECTKNFNGSFPVCHVYYVTASSESPDEIFKGICERSSQEICRRFKAYIQDCDIHVTGHNYVFALYNEINNNISSTVNLQTCQMLNEIKDVMSAYIGYLKAEEYLKIICNNDGELRRYIFYENVRDYQGEKNSVNQEIRSTLQDKNTRGQFIILNNGITIITKNMDSLGGNKYNLSGFQIVNGCQTSNEIYNERENVSEVLVPVKIIHTSDSELISRIVRAANRQTAVPEESFISLGQFHKNLQMMISEYSKEMPIEVFYERRSGERPASGNFDNTYQIITLHGIIRAAESVFFQRPDKAAKNNPANILKNEKNEDPKLFRDNHVQEAYFTACYLVVILADLCKKGILNHDAYVMRYYIAMSVWMLINGDTSVVRLDDKRLKKVCENIIELLKKDCTEYYTTAYDIIRRTKEEGEFFGQPRYVIRREDFLNAVIRNMNTYINENKKNGYTV